MLRRELRLDHQDKVDNSRDDTEVSRRKKTEGKRTLVTLQHPVLGQDPVLQQVGLTHQLVQYGEGAETRGAES